MCLESDLKPGSHLVRHSPPALNKLTNYIGIKTESNKIPCILLTKCHKSIATGWYVRVSIKISRFTVGEYLPLPNHPEWTCRPMHHVEWKPNRSPMKSNSCFVAGHSMSYTLHLQGTDRSKFPRNNCGLFAMQSSWKLPYRIWRCTWILRSAQRT